MQNSKFHWIIPAEPGPPNSMPSHEGFPHPYPIATLIGSVFTQIGQIGLTGDLKWLRIFTVGITGESVPIGDSESYDLDIGFLKLTLAEDIRTGEAQYDLIVEGYVNPPAGSNLVRLNSLGPNLKARVGYAQMEHDFGGLINRKIHFIGGMDVVMGYVDPRLFIGPGNSIYIKRISEIEIEIQF